MSKVEYKPSRFKIGIYSCVYIPKELPEDPLDKMLSGRKGWIMETGKDKTKLVAYSVNYKGEEEIYPFDIKDLRLWVSRIDLPASPKVQAEFANNPNSRKSNRKVKYKI